MEYRLTKFTLCDLHCWTSYDGFSMGLRFARAMKNVYDLCAQIFLLSEVGCIYWSCIYEQLLVHETFFSGTLSVVILIGTMDFHLKRYVYVSPCFFIRVRQSVQLDAVLSFHTFGSFSCLSSLWLNSWRCRLCQSPCLISSRLSFVRSSIDLMVQNVRIMYVCGNTHTHTITNMNSFVHF